MPELYTFVLDYKGGTYISQTVGESPADAATDWIKNRLDLQVIGVKDDTVEDILRDIEFLEEHPLPITGLKNVWCLSFLADDELALVNIVKTAQQ
jgi:hypothetical protein